MVAGVYAWCDFFNNTFQFSICSGFYEEINYSEVENAEIQRKWTYFLIYKSFSSIPFTFFSSFIVVSLTYRSCVYAIDYLYRKFIFKLWYRNIQINEDNENSSKKDSFCCDLFDVNDEHEIIFSIHDVKYVLDLFETNKTGVVKKSFKKTSEYNYTVAKVERKNFGQKIMKGKNSIWI